MEVIELKAGDVLFDRDGYPIFAIASRTAAVVRRTHSEDVIEDMIQAAKRHAHIARLGRKRLDGKRNGGDNGEQ